MMVIYVPVMFEFDWTNCFRVKVRKRNMWTDRQTDKKRDKRMDELRTQSNRRVGYTQPAYRQYQ